MKAGRATRPTQCHYCKGVFPPDKITRDHVIPRSRGGRTNARNLVPACLRCNQRKASSAPVCMCDTCRAAFQYHRDVIEGVRVHSPSWADAMVEILGPDCRILVYGLMTDPSPAELGLPIQYVSTEPAHRILRIMSQ